jgi:hypothetical protein
LRACAHGQRERGSGEDARNEDLEIAWFHRHVSFLAAIEAAWDL